jgi:glycosyltransferase involved in cell wall biosynthesis
MQHDLISIILPVYKQADHIEIVVREYIDALSKLQNPHELILVVNGCSKAEFGAYAGLDVTYKTVKLMHLKVGGWGRAVRAGLEAAGGSMLCYTNSARTSPQDLVMMLIYALTQPDVIVKANRKIRESLVRRIGSLLYNLECRTLFDLVYWDVNGTPKVFPRKFDDLLRMERDDDLIDLEFNVICRRNEYPVIEVPLFSTKRHGGSSTTSARSALRMYLRAIGMWRAMKR